MLIASISFRVVVIAAALPSAPDGVNAKFGDAVAVDAALSWVSSPGRFTCPAAYSNDSYRYVADMMATCGIRHVRERMRWTDVAPSPEKFKPGRYLRNAEMLVGRGIGISSVFADSPSYARPSPKLPCDLLAVYDFCRALAECFGNRMEMWEFWNEEDIQYVVEPAWEYVSAFKAAALGFRAGGFRGIVAPGAQCQSTRGVYDRTFFLNDAMKYADVFNFHTYVPPVRYPTEMAGLRKLLGEFGEANRAIVLTECGTNQEGDSRDDGVMPGLKAHSPEQERIQAEFAVKSQILTRMEGAMRNYFFVFGAFNERNGKKDWGLLRRDGTAKPAVAAIKRLIDEVGDGVLAGEVLVPGGQVRAFRFDFADGRHKLVYWSRSEIDDSTKDPITWQEHSRLFGLRLENGESLELTARREPAYIELASCVPVARRPLPIGRQTARVDTGDDLTVVMQVEFEPGKSSIGGNKSQLELKGESISLNLRLWNLDDKAKSGHVSFVGGGTLKGLPETVSLQPRSSEVLALEYGLADAEDASIAFEGVFNGRKISRFAVPVFSERKYLKNTNVLELDWKNLKRWARNTSAKEYSCEWDEREHALRFHFAWDDRAQDRWFFPSYELKLPEESLDRAILVTYEVKSMQDKVENDYGGARVFIKGRKSAPQNFFNTAPGGEWETRRQELGESVRSCDAIRLEFGGHPRGRDVTYFLRNIRIYQLDPMEQHTTQKE